MPEVQLELHAMLRKLHLSGMADNFGDLALKAASAHLTYETYLAEVVHCCTNAGNRCSGAWFLGRRGCSELANAGAECGEDGGGGAASGSGELVAVGGGDLVDE